jgi:hypothetical protein
MCHEKRLAFSSVHKREVMTYAYDIVTIWYSSDVMSPTAVLEHGKMPKPSHHAASSQTRHVE